MGLGVALEVGGLDCTNVVIQSILAASQGYEKQQSSLSALSADSLSRM